MASPILAFGILVVNHTIFSSLGLYFIRGYGGLPDTRKFFFLSLFEMGIPLAIYLALRKSGLLLSSLAFSAILVYFAIFIALTRLTYVELHTGQIFVMIAVNGIGVSLLGILNSLGPVFLYIYMFLTVAFGIFWTSGAVNRQKRLKKIKADLTGWEKDRRAWIQDQLASRQFHTFCFECCHFTRDSRACGLELYVGSVPSIRFPFIRGETFCPYWNVSDHPNIKKPAIKPDLH